MIGVHDKHSSGAAAIRGVDQHPPLACFLHQTFDRCGVRADDCHHAPRTDHIAKADVDEFHRLLHNILFQILDLLADFFDLRLHIHHNTGDIQILTLGADGVGLAVQLLSQEVQLAAHGLVQLQDIAVLGNVAAQTDSFFIHGSLIAKDGGFGQHTGVINVTILQDDLEFLVQAVGVVFHPACTQALNFADALLQKHKTAFHVCLHLGALGGC